jgi:hypothetical protein
MGSIHPSILHEEHIAKRLTKQQRKELHVQTSAEAIEKAKAGEEEELQKQVRQYLNLHDLPFINPSMKRRSALPKGWPDFTFGYRGYAIAVECKTEVGRLSSDQQIMRQQLVSKGWRYILAQSLADVQQVFREIDEQKDGKPSPWPIITK